VTDGCSDNLEGRKNVQPSAGDQMRRVDVFEESTLVAKVKLRSVRQLFLSSVFLSVFLLPAQPSLIAESKTTKKVSLFKGRAVLVVPKTSKSPQKLYTNLVRVEPTDSTKKCVLYVSRDPLGSDETKMKNKALGDSIKTRLQGDGYTISSFKTQGSNFTANFTGFTEVPWQKVGAAPVRGLGRFIRTADKQLIGSVLLCDPTTWTDASISGYKTAVSKTVVSQR